MNHWEDIVPPALSTGMPSTLGSYLALCKAVFGPESPATKFIADKIAESKKGPDEYVLADESQMVYLLGTMHINHNVEEASK